MEKSSQIIEEKSDGFFRRIQEENTDLTQPIQSCLIWPVQKMMKYVQLLKEILDCIAGLTIFFLNPRLFCGFKL